MARPAWLLLAVVISGCSLTTRIALDPQVRDELASAPVIHFVVYPSQAPGLMTAKAISTGALFGPFGGAAVGARAAAIGQEMMTRYGVAPLSAQLAARLETDLRATLPSLKRVSETPTAGDPESLQKAGLVPLVLDVRSAGNIIYYASNWARYRLFYDARVRLVDTQKARVLWQAACSLRGAEDPATAPTLDELEAEDGVAYRRLLGDAIGACAIEIMQQFRGTAPAAGR